TPKTLTDEARIALLGHRWPGNIRELANAIERAALLSEDRQITAEDLGLSSEPMVAPEEREHAENSAGFRESLDRIERTRLLEALRRAHWNLSLAAEQLRVPRNTLRYRIQRSGLEKVYEAERSQRMRLAPVPPGDVKPTNGKGAGRRSASQWERRSITFLSVRIEASTTETTPIPVIPDYVELIDGKVRTFGGQTFHVDPLR